MYAVAVAVAGILFVTGIIAFRKIFFTLIENTTALLNVMLDSQMGEDEKQKMLVARLGKLLGSFAIFILVLVMLLVVTALPIGLYALFTGSTMEQLDFSSWRFLLVLGVSSLLPFIIQERIAKKKDYSDLSQLFHRIIFNNRNIARQLFQVEKYFYATKIAKREERFVIISGLARAGTTALTTVLHASNKFHSLSYGNMPMLMSPHLWRVFYKPKEGKLKERSHGDRVLFGYNTVEALEEYFWKVFLHDKFIGEKTLTFHEVDPTVYQEYITYQNLIKPDLRSTSLYLAKNNNFILRYASVRKLNPDFVILILFRDPVEHAYSLLNQHQRYTRFQQEDAFVLEYMNWLGHHEFGLNHKYFDLLSAGELEPYDPQSMSYWLRIWIAYYTYILNLPADHNLMLIDYHDFLFHPEQVVSAIGQKLNINLGGHRVEKFDNTKAISFDGDPALKARAMEVYHQLQTKRTVFG